MYIAINSRSYQEEESIIAGKDKKTASERKKAWEIDCNTAKELIEKSQGNWENLDSIEGFKLSSHMAICSTCSKKMEKAVKKSENATENKSAF